MGGQVIGSVPNPGGSRDLHVWRDRLGNRHTELRTTPRRREPSVDRVVGSLEASWTDTVDVEARTHEALARPNPFIEPDPVDPESTLWTWTFQDPDARSVMLWTNPVFDHSDVARMELARLPGSDLWTICLRMPASLRASYRISVWHQDDEPPWRAASGRRPVIRAATRASVIDPRGADIVHGSRGEASSVAAGPLAPTELWRGLEPAVGSRVDEVTLPGDERAWVYSPGRGTATPLLVLYDGQVWRKLGLPSILDAMIGAGQIPPLHVAMLDSGDQNHRREALGVPGRQVDTVIDELLPRVRSGWDVAPDGAATLVSGQSLGGIASLWTVALSGGQVQHAIAQSASLWRFDVAEALLGEPAWRSIELHAGTYEGDMLSDARTLAATLSASGRSVTCHGFEAGHDWAVWRANLIRALCRWSG